MTETGRKILQEALALAPAERAVLVDALTSSLDPPDPGIDAAWAEEAEDRLRAYRAGELEAVPAEQVFAELKGL